jgi:hypothetical protein
LFNLRFLAGRVAVRQLGFGRQERRAVFPRGSRIGEFRERRRSEPTCRGLREQLVIARASDFLLTHIAARGVARISF